jgi:hypothetical protein
MFFRLGVMYKEKSGNQGLLDFSCTTYQNGEYAKNIRNYRKIYLHNAKPNGHENYPLQGLPKFGFFV